MEEVGVEGRGLSVGGVIEKGFDSLCAPPMKITTLSYAQSAMFALEVGQIRRKSFVSKETL